MTDAQRDALEKAENLLIEHFDAYVIAVDVGDVNDDNDHLTAGSWQGGVARAIGLCEIQKARLLHQQMNFEQE